MNENEYNKTIAVAILARNCILSLKKNFRELEKLSKYYSLDYFIIENDSTDGTKQFLKELKKSLSNITLISFNNADLPSNKQIVGNRIQKMVQYRNLYMNEITFSAKKYNYILMVDIDVDCFSAVSIKDSILNMPKDAVGVFANGRYFFRVGKLNILTNYYDLYALELNGLKRNIDKLYSLKKQLKRNRFVPCDSAFAGIGIYNYESIKSLRYQYTEIGGQSICEHIPFNTKASQNGKLYVDKELLVRYEKISLVQFLKFLVFPIWLKKVFF